MLALTESLDPYFINKFYNLIVKINHQDSVGSMQKYLQHNLKTEIKQLIDMQNLLTQYDRQNKFLNKQVLQLLQQNKSLKIGKVKDRYLQNLTNSRKQGNYLNRLSRYGQSNDVKKWKQQKENNWPHQKDSLVKKEAVNKKETLANNEILTKNETLTKKETLAKPDTIAKKDQGIQVDCGIQSIAISQKNKNAANQIEPSIFTLRASKAKQSPNGKESKCSNQKSRLGSSIAKVESKVLTQNGGTNIHIYEPSSTEMQVYNLQQSKQSDKMQHYSSSSPNKKGQILASSKTEKSRLINENNKERSNLDCEQQKGNNQKNQQKRSNIKQHNLLSSKQPSLKTSIVNETVIKSSHVHNKQQQQRGIELANQKNNKQSKQSGTERVNQSRSKQSKQRGIEHFNQSPNKQSRYIGTEHFNQNKIVNIVHGDNRSKKEQEQEQYQQKRNRFTITSNKDSQIYIPSSHSKSLYRQKQTTIISAFPKPLAIPNDISRRINHGHRQSHGSILIKSPVYNFESCYEVREQNPRFLIKQVVVAQQNNIHRQQSPHQNRRSVRSHHAIQPSPKIAPAKSEKRLFNFLADASQNKLIKKVQSTELFRQSESSEGKRRFIQIISGKDTIERLKKYSESSGWCC